jgi:hypothetical protein
MCSEPNFDPTVLPSGIRTSDNPFTALLSCSLWPNLLHVVAALLPAFVRGDGVFDVMAPVSSDDEVAPEKSL